MEQNGEGLQHAIMPKQHGLSAPRTSTFSMRELDSESSWRMAERLLGKGLGRRRNNGQFTGKYIFLKVWTMGLRHIWAILLHSGLMEKGW
jgi:hypothetical protein